MKPYRAPSGIAVPILTFLLAFSLTSGPVLAQTTVSATTTSGGNWTSTSPATWTCSPAVSPCIPNNNASDVFDVGINGGFVTLDGYTSSPSTITINALSISSDQALSLYNGATLSIRGNLTGAGFLELDTYLDPYISLGSNGGSTLNVGGNLTSGPNGAIQIGYGGTDAPSALNVAGAFDNQSGYLQLYGGQTISSQSTMTVGGTAPGALTGIVNLIGNNGGAVLSYGSGGITQVGDGFIDSRLALDGSNAFVEVGAASGNTALASLTTITYNGQLQLSDGASVTTTGPLTNRGTLTLTNGGKMTVGGGAPSTLTGTITLTGNTGGAVLDYQGGGGVTQIGDGSTNGSSLTLDGANAFIEVGEQGGNSALTGLTTIAANGGLVLQDGAEVATAGAM